MNLMIWLLVGGVVVWLTVLSMSASVWQVVQQNVVVGLAGAIGGGYLLSPLITVETIDANFVSVPTLVMAALGASSLLTLVKWLSVR